MSGDFEVVLEVGKGKTTLLCVDANEDVQPVESLAETLGQFSRAVVLEVSRYQVADWEASLEAVFESLSLRGFSIIGFGKAGLLGKYIALTRPRAVRSLALVNGQFSQQQAGGSKLLKWVDRRLPLGLPFVQGSGFSDEIEGFSSAAFLQRVRCPTLLLTTGAGENPDEALRLKEICETMPTAWYLDVADSSDVSQLAEYLIEFQKIPTRCPQKNLRAQQ